MIDLLLLARPSVEGGEVDVVLEDGPTLAVSLTVWIEGRSIGRSWQTRTLHVGDLCRGVVG